LCRRCQAHRLLHGAPAAIGDQQRRSLAALQDILCMENAIMGGAVHVDGLLWLYRVPARLARTPVGAAIVCNALVNIAVRDVV